MRLLSNTKKGHEIKAHQQFVDKNLNTSFRTFYKGFLTDKEIGQVIDGQDMWMGKDDILSRLTNLYASKLEPETTEDTPSPVKKRGRPKAA